MSATEEKAILSRFQNNYPAFPDGKVIHSDKPDFVIHGKTKIGIEITQVFKDQDSTDGSFLKSKETFQRNLLSSICSYLNSSGFPKCIINIDLNDNKYSKKLRARQIGQLCYNDIQIKFKSVNNKIYGGYEIRNNGDLPEIINSYSIWIDEALDETEYVESASSLGTSLTNSFIQFIIDKKEKAKLQFEKCDLYWLIIKEGSFEADYFGQILIDKTQLNTTFDKLFIIRQFNSEILELR